jgi:hypothetical protein
MIRDMKESDLQQAETEEVVAMVREYGRYNWASSEAIDSAAAEIDRIRRLPAPVRGVIATYLRTNELFCNVCGETSCIHGYPDD